MTGDRPWPQVPVGNKDHTNAAVVIIGGGISGICTAIDLIRQNNCRNFIIIEKSAGLGGTWLDNKYPGCCCDVTSIMYSFSFAQSSEWSRIFPGQEEILAYLTRVAQEYQLYQHFRFNTSVEHATWDDAAAKWRVHVKPSSGSKEAEFSPEYDITTDFLISAVGQLNVPQWPKIDGLDDFSGKKMHSARWDWSYDLTGKKIALIGNGCSAVQILPEITKVAKEVTLFQRTPNWIFPRNDIPIPSAVRKVFRYVPGVQSRLRATLMDMAETNYDSLIASDPKGVASWKAASEQMMKAQLPDQPDLWDKLTPKYDIGCKRIIVSDDYFPAIAQDHVHLETRPIHHIDGRTIHVANAADGAPEPATPHDFDLLVCATGFQTVDFMHPIELRGRGGRSLRSDVWRDGARALYGVAVEDMPNFGMLYGPNTNLGHNSIVLMVEAQSRYLNALLAPVLAARVRGQQLALRPRAAVLDAHNARLQAELRATSWNDPKCQSWYKNAAGRITNNWSGKVVEYQKLLATLCFDDYEAEGSGSALVREKPTRHLGRIREETLFSNQAVLLMGAASTVALVGGWVLRNSRFLEKLRAG